MDIKAFKDKLFTAALSEGIEAIEIFYMQSANLKVSTYNRKVENLSNSNQGGYGARGLYNGKMGYYYSETISEKDIPLVIDAIKQSAEIIDSEDKVFIYEGDSKYEAVDIYNDDLNNYSLERKIEDALLMEKTALEYDERITDVGTSLVSSGESETYIANSKGLELEGKENYIVAYVEVIAREGENTKEKGEIWFGRAADFAPEDIAKKAAKKAISALGGSAVPSGKYSLIINNEVFADILGCFAGSFYADKVQKGFSLLKDRLNTKIASDIVWISDDPLMENGIASASFDCEGVACYNKNVVEKGVLKTYLHNLKTAYKDGVKSTGNGFKSSFKGTVSTSTTNFYIQSGTEDYNDLVKELDTGIIITEVAGLHSGANGITGDFSLAAEGFYVEKGEIVKPVEQITIAANFFEVLKNIEKMADDLYFSSSGIGSPSILIGNISVSGE